MKVLVFCGDVYHPARTVREGLSGLGQAGFEFDFVTDTAGWAMAGLTAYPLVMLAKANQMSEEDERPWMTEEIQAALAGHVRQGNGLLAVHAGTAGYENAQVLRALLGGVFTHHPEQCAVTVTPKEGHPLTSGAAPFMVQDEHYFMALDDLQADVFLTTVSKHGEQPGGWARTEGQGRVCVLTPGHNLAVWEQPAFQALLLNALQWCGKSSNQ